ncbi:hypothetical protein CEH05_18830 [Halobacillus halophilus]|nr:hypothetical protein CEH05_18830 [Halobacillus halophilus]
MWFANFFIAGSITMVLPFLSLYIDQLGNFSDSFVQTWSGGIFEITFVMAHFFQKNKYFDTLNIYHEFLLYKKEIYSIH